MPSSGVTAAVFNNARDSLAHRGPNGRGTWISPSNEIALGHRRLSIIDLSAAGDQPMRSPDGRFVMVLNGEIYNHSQLRNQLATQLRIPSSGWQGHSDTETLLACFSAWGVETTLSRIKGMFAVALWDCESRSLVLARDRLGEKPLYYGVQGQRFVFASELKALRRLPGFTGRVCIDAAATFLRRNFIPAPMSIYQGIFKLMPGCWIRVDLAGAPTFPTQSHTYWSASEVASHAAGDMYSGTMDQACDELEQHLLSAVQSQLISDVPVGAFLSGGIDSSLIAAYLRNCSDRTIRFMCVGSSNPTYDESQHARSVARDLGVDVSIELCSPEDVLAAVPQLSTIWDEPLGDSSQLPTWLICKRASHAVSVALSGDGGDELFLGYPNYARMRLLRAGLGSALAPWAAIAHFLQLLGFQRIARQLKAYVRAGKILDDRDYVEFISNFYRDDPFPCRINLSGVVHPKVADLKDIRSTAALLDLVTYLPDDILFKVDRAAMSNGLETRAPFLDRDVVEFSLKLPVKLKYAPGKHKRILRHLLARHLPRSHFNRRKQGFSIPVAEWLRSDLKEWAEERLKSLKNNEDFWDLPRVNAMWKQHQAGVRDHSQRLWGIFSLAPFLAD